MIKKPHRFITKALLLLIASVGNLKATDPASSPTTEDDLSESVDQYLSTEDFLFAPMVEDISFHDSEIHEGDSPKKGEWVIFPLPSRSPTMGWTVTVPVTTIYRPSNVAEDAPAWATGAAAFYTENESFGGGLFHKMNLNEDRWRLMFAGFYSDLNYDFYGIGALENDLGIQVPLNQTVGGGMAEAMRKISGKLFGGVRVTGMQTTVGLGKTPNLVPPDLENSLDLEDLRANFDLFTFAPKLLYDTRDNEFYPTRGNQIKGELQISSEDTGSSADYRIFKTSWDRYQQVGENGVLALRLSSKYASGDTPFFLYPAFGQQGDLRGYTPGTYRDRILVAFQGEYRLRFTQRLGGVLFAGVGGVGPELGDLGEALPSGGFGLRYVLAQENNISLRMDIAWGRDESQFYFGIGEAF